MSDGGLGREREETRTNTARRWPGGGIRRWEGRGRDGGGGREGGEEGDGGGGGGGGESDWGNFSRGNGLRQSPVVDEDRVKKEEKTGMTGMSWPGQDDGVGIPLSARQAS
ncbi:uncharacterized protein CIMG_13538 [Coccidioides immitis RS]|uniref:Uncharacterized protein n=1 Tax=Coccidioides immitis (strain RS) TaxID=246410 RepID=A0A0D8JVC8_COCIM|nr:uncharacterized protein CIMG_13538 [Coccidioides immitis RS]KJF61252.1 hypothetical protein CIMG_13538 [Coccidioides immitis RS]